MSNTSENKHVLPSELITHLQSVLLDLEAHHYPDITNPEGVPKRASVALIIRIQPNYSHWPPKSQDTVLLDSGDPPSRIKSFFAQEWVQRGDPEVLFIKRAARKGDKWTSHVALPGGRRDPEDADDCAAAVREAWEEVGIDLSEEFAVSAGNLPQQVVSSGWGKVPYADRRSWGLMSPFADEGRRLMVLCPYVFLMTGHEIPPLNLQPTEVASTHWVPLRALLSPRQRTFWYQDVSNRTSQQEFGMTRMFHKLAIGDMMFAAVRLIPSESKYCSSIAEFMPQEEVHNEPYSFNHTAPIISTGHKPGSPVDKPLLLWGLTLGVMGDFLDMLPPYNALRIWTYPTFTVTDVRFMLWLLSYRFREQREKELDRHRVCSPSAEAEAKESGRPAARIRLDQNGSRSNAVGLLLEGYYKIVRQAVIATFVARGTITLGAVFLLWKWRQKLRR